MQLSDGSAPLGCPFSIWSMCVQQQAPPEHAASGQTCSEERSWGKAGGRKGRCQPAQHTWTSQDSQRRSTGPGQHSPCPYRRCGRTRTALRLAPQPRLSTAREPQQRFAAALPRTGPEHARASPQQHAAAGAQRGSASQNPPRASQPAPGPSGRHIRAPQARARARARGAARGGGGAANGRRARPGANSSTMERAAAAPLQPSLARAPRD